MTDNLATYKKAFMDSFDSLDGDTIFENLAYETILEWDSVGHMGLMAELEEAFHIEMSMDDVIDFSSFEKGKEVLLRYEIVV